MQQLLLATTARRCVQPSPKKYLFLLTDYFSHDNLAAPISGELGKRIPRWFWDPHMGFSGLSTSWGHWSDKKLEWWASISIEIDLTSLQPLPKLMLNKYVIMVEHLNLQVVHNLKGTHLIAVQKLSGDLNERPWRLHNWGTRWAD